MGIGLDVYDDVSLVLGHYAGLCERQKKTKRLLSFPFQAREKFFRFLGIVLAMAVLLTRRLFPLIFKSWIKGKEGLENMKKKAWRNFVLESTRCLTIGHYAGHASARRLFSFFQSFRFKTLDEEKGRAGEQQMKTWHSFSRMRWRQEENLAGSLYGLLPRICSGICLLPSPTTSVGEIASLLLSDPNVFM